MLLSYAIDGLGGCCCCSGSCGEGSCSGIQPQVEGRFLQQEEEEIIDWNDRRCHLYCKKIISLFFFFSFDGKCASVLLASPSLLSLPLQFGTLLIFLLCILFFYFISYSETEKFLLMFYSLELSKLIGCQTVVLFSVLVCPTCLFFCSEFSLRCIFICMIQTRIKYEKYAMGCCFVCNLSINWEINIGLFMYKSQHVSSYWKKKQNEQKYNKRERGERAHRDELEQVVTVRYLLG